MSKNVFLSKSFLIVVAVLVVLATLLGVFAINTNANPAKAEDVFVAEDEMVIAHLTDMHYFPLSYAYMGGGDNDFTNRVKTSAKLTAESHLYNIAAINGIVEMNPDYLVITGDQTTDGEIQGHVEIANLLRGLQNTIRANGNPDFQVLVSLGNHDLYNEDAFDYSVDGSKRVTPNVTRTDIIKIYSSLGYPDLSDEEIIEFYDSKLDLHATYPPYDDALVTGNTASGVKFINSTTATSTSIEWLYKENGAEGKLANGEIDDYDQGEMTYVANIKDNYTIISMDETVSTEETQHHLGGILHDNIQAYLTEKKQNGDFEGRVLACLSHRNPIPHFDGEESLLKDFTYYNTFETTDILADLGIRYSYSGHMHANDINSRVSLNGNLLIDTQTASSTGFKCAVRYTKIERGTVGDKYAENFSTYIKLTEEVDVTSLIDLGLADEDYFKQYGIDKYVEVKDGRTIITNPSEYAAGKLFLNIVENLVYGYVNVDFIGGAGEFVADLLPDSGMFASIKGMASQLVDNIVRHAEEVILKDYVYGGDNPDFKGTEKGAKLCGYVDELLQEALNMTVNSQGDTLFDFVINAYLDHVGGRDVAYADASEGTKEALALFKDGTNVEKLLNILLDKESGLYRIVVGLLEPIDLAYGLSDEEVSALNGLLGILGTGLDVHALELDAIAPGVLKLLGIDLDIGKDGLKAFVDHTLESYVTDSFYTSLGEIAHNIVYAFKIDETANMENSFDGYTVYKPDASLQASYVEGEIDNTPTVARGQLPAQITVTFGQDPKTTKNFVWFTDKSITGTDIEYYEATATEADSTFVTGEYQKYVTTTANIDLGIFATLMHIEVGRHSIELEGLKPGTKYMYRVGSKEDNYWSELYSFTTAPDDNAPFEILLMSDIQGSAQKPYIAAEAIMANIEEVFQNGYDFIINCGDVVDNTRNWVQWEYYLEGGLQKYWANSTTVVANGNHDKYAYEKPDEDKLKFEYEWIDSDAIMDSYNYLLLHYGLSYPAQDTTTGAYYSFDYSDVHFTVLNTNDYDKDGLGAQQVEWLKEDLSTTTKTYKVVMMHKSIYSVGSHTNDAEIVKMRKQLSEIFAKQNVSLVLAGHDHTYTESFYISYDEKAKNYVTVENDLTGKSEIGKGNGVLYITLGTFGDKYYNYVGNDKVPVEFGEDLHDPMLSNPTFGKLIYDGEKLYYVGYEYDLETGEIREIRSNNNVGLVESIVVIACSASVVGVVAIILAKIAKRRK